MIELNLTGLVCNTVFVTAIFCTNFLLQFLPKIYFLTFLKKIIQFIFSIDPHSKVFKILAAAIRFTRICKWTFLVNKFSNLFEIEELKSKITAEAELKSWPIDLIILFKKINDEVLQFMHLRFIVSQKKKLMDHLFYPSLCKLNNFCSSQKSLVYFA